MTTRTVLDGQNELVDELRRLEDFFPLLETTDEYEELEDEIRELEELVAAAGEAADEQSTKALAYLQAELLRKRELLEGF
jgi:hypothetical protein